MRVLILHSRYMSGSVSGENRVVDDDARLLSEHGHEVISWTPSPDELGSPLQAASRAIWSTGAVHHLRSLVERFEPDVVHVHNLYPMLSPAVLRAVPPQVGLVMSLHNYRYSCLPGTFLLDGRICEDCLGRLPWRGIVRGCYRDSRAASLVLGTSISAHRLIGSFARIDRFLALGEFMRLKHIEAGVPADRIVVRSNFVDGETRRTGSGDYFLYLGRLAPEKGVRFLVGLWHEIEAPLLVVGDGPERDALRSIAGPGVSIQEAVTGDEVPAILRGARALLVPSQWYEGQPRSVLEAYSVGVPVLASDIGALPETVDAGRSGYLLPPNSASAWVEAIRSLLDDRVAVRLGDEAYRLWVERYGPKTSLSALERAYREALDRRRSVTGVPSAGAGAVR
jgi:glycosyltransferase involved in cell wall biosynthesis